MDYTSIALSLVVVVIVLTVTGYLLVSFYNATRDANGGTLSSNLQSIFQKVSQAVSTVSNFFIIIVLVAIVAIIIRTLITTFQGGQPPSV